MFPLNPILTFLDKCRTHPKIILNVQCLMSFHKYCNVIPNYCHVHIYSMHVIVRSCDVSYIIQCMWLWGHVMSVILFNAIVRLNDVSDIIQCMWLWGHMMWWRELHYLMHVIVRSCDVIFYSMHVIVRSCDVSYIIQCMWLWGHVMSDTLFNACDCEVMWCQLQYSMHVMPFWWCHDTLSQ